MVDLPNNNPQLYQRIQLRFQQPIKSISEINYFFFKNNSQFFQNFQYYNKEESTQFLKYFNELRKLVFNFDELFPDKRIPFLKTGQPNCRITLTRKQVAAIFLLSFFNCIEINQKNNSNCFYVFNVLRKINQIKYEKGRCFINYLTQIGKWLSKNDEILNEKIVYIRDCIQPPQEYEDKELCEIKIFENGSIFDGEAEYCVDFANKYIGGGVLNDGNVQEEILFCIDPEAIVSLFLMEMMGENDAIGIHNTIQYSNYIGYGASFKFNGSAIPSDIKKIKRHKIIAIDAINLNKQKFNNNINKNINNINISKNDLNKFNSKTFNNTKINNNLIQSVHGFNTFNNNYGNNMINKFNNNSNNNSNNFNIMNKNNNMMNHNMGNNNIMNNNEINQYNMMNSNMIESNKMVQHNMVNNNIINSNLINSNTMNMMNKNMINSNNMMNKNIINYNMVNNNINSNYMMMNNNTNNNMLNNNINSNNMMNNNNNVINNNMMNNNINYNNMINNNAINNNMMNNNTINNTMMNNNTINIVMMNHNMMNNNMINNNMMNNDTINNMMNNNIINNNMINSNNMMNNNLTNYNNNNNLNNNNNYNNYNNNMNFSENQNSFNNNLNNNSNYINNFNNQNNNNINGENSVVNNYDFQNEIKFNITRDMHKAYVGFILKNPEDENEEKTISTGNWGCGAFGGNHQLKFLQQWIAASLAGVKRLDYYTFKDKKMEGVAENSQIIKYHFKTALKLYHFLIKYYHNLEKDNIINSILKLNYLLKK